MDPNQLLCEFQHSNLLCHCSFLLSPSPNPSISVESHISTPRCFRFCQIYCQHSEESEEFPIFFLLEGSGHTHTAALLSEKRVHVSAEKRPESISSPVWEKQASPRTIERRKFQEMVMGERVEWGGGGVKIWSLTPELMGNCWGMCDRGIVEPV